MPSIGAYPVPLPWYVPSQCCYSGEGFELLLTISTNTIPTLSAAIQAFSKVSGCESSTYSRILGLSYNKPVQHFIISDTHYKRCSMIECSYIATYITYTILHIFFQFIPSPPVPIFMPKIILYQFFQVLLHYKVLIQVLTLQSKSCIVGQQHGCKPSI